MDIFVNNAGVLDALEPMGECDREMWDRVMGVNVAGTYIASKLGVDTMLAQENRRRRDSECGQCRGI